MNEGKPLPVADIHEALVRGDVHDGGRGPPTQ